MIARSAIEGSEYKAMKIFYSYSRNNAPMRDSFDDILSKYKWDVQVEPWYDGNIPAGDLWENNLYDNLYRSDIILLFISNAFLKSHYCYDVEMNIAMQLHEQGKARVIPIVLEETDPDWRKLPFARLQVLPQNGQPVNRWSDSKEAFDNISQSIVNIISEQGINPRTRIKWKLVLNGNIEKFDADERLGLVTQLRAVSGDGTLRPVRLKAGSIVMLMESTMGAYSKLIGLYQKGALGLLNGYSILDMHELYGAGVRANCCFTEEDGEPDNIKPDPELLLFPSKRSHEATLNVIQVNPEENVNFQFGVDTVGPECDGRPMSDADKKAIQGRFFEYFFTALSMKNEDAWVNLGPDDRNRMLPEYLSGTSMGRIMLDSDYNLKRLSSSLIHPDCETGKRFWKKVFSAAQDKFSTTEMPYDVFTRVWMVPGEIILYEWENWCYLAYSSLKVMCEKDFLMEYSISKESKEPPVSEICYDAFKEVVLPEICKEINEGETFASLRELYSCMIMAQWCKKRFGDRPSMNNMVDNGKYCVKDADGIKFVDSIPIPGNEDYHKKYMDVFKNGVFYEVRSDYDIYTNKKAVRTYFSGSIDFTGIGSRLKAISNKSMVIDRLRRDIS